MSHQYNLRTLPANNVEYEGRVGVDVAQSQANVEIASGHSDVEVSSMSNEDVLVVDKTATSGAPITEIMSTMRTAFPHLSSHSEEIVATAHHQIALPLARATRAPAVASFESPSIS